jgi:hypothetical protein
MPKSNLAAIYILPPADASGGHAATAPIPAVKNLAFCSPEDYGKLHPGFPAPDRGNAADATG